MTKNDRPIKIRLGLNFVTSLITALVLFMEGVILILCAIGHATRGNGQWMYAVYFLVVFASIWGISFIIALIVCKKTLIIMGSVLKVTKSGQTIYETSLVDVRWIEFEPFAPLTRSQIGELIISSKKPLPSGLNLYMDWFSYKKVSKRIHKFQNSIKNE